jgi:polyhydroxyalkanoate synthesis regulator phasin
MKTEEKLLQLKEKIDRSKTKLNELSGKESHLLEQLKEDYACSTVDEANEKLETLDEEIQDLESKIKTGLEELEQKYEITVENE